MGVGCLQAELKVYAVEKHFLVPDYRSDTSGGIQLEGFTIAGNELHIINAVYAATVGFAPGSVDRPDVGHLDSKKRGKIRGPGRPQGSKGLDFGNRPIVTQWKFPNASLPFNLHDIRLSGSDVDIFN